MTALSPPTANTCPFLRRRFYSGWHPVRSQEAPLRRLRHQLTEGIISDPAGVQEALRELITGSQGIVQRDFRTWLTQCVAQRRWTDYLSGSEAKGVSSNGGVSVSDAEAYVEAYAASSAISSLRFPGWYFNGIRVVRDQLNKGDARQSKVFHHRMPRGGLYLGPGGFVLDIRLGSSETQPPPVLGFGDWGVESSQIQYVEPQPDGFLALRAHFKRTVIETEDAVKEALRESLRPLAGSTLAFDGQARLKFHRFDHAGTKLDNGTILAQEIGPDPQEWLDSQIETVAAQGALTQAAWWLVTGREGKPDQQTLGFVSLSALRRPPPHGETADRLLVSGVRFPAAVG